MYTYVGPGARAAERSDLGHVLSFLRDEPSGRVVSERFLSLLDFSDSAGVCDGRACFVSCWFTQISLFLNFQRFELSTAEP